MNKVNKKISLFGQGKIFLIITCFFVCINSLIAIGIAFILQKMIDAGTTKNMVLMENLILVSIVYLVLSLIFSILEYVLKNRYVKNVMVRYKSDIIDNFLNKNLQEFKVSNTGSYISILNNDIKIIETDYVEAIFNIIRQIVLFVGGVAAMVYVSYKVFLLVIICSLLPVIVSVAFSKQTADKQNKVSDSYSTFTTAIKDMFSGFTVIKSYNIEKEIASNLLSFNKKLEIRKNKYNNVVGLVGSLSGACGFLVVIVAFGFGSYLCIKGEITTGSVIAIIQLLNYLLGPINEAANLMNRRNAAAKIVDKVNHIVKESSNNNTEKIAKEKFYNSLEFRDVSFSYGGNKNALSNLNFKFEKGKKYALVGLSGSGKTTLINLFMGYYQNYQGTIYIDDTELNNIDTNYLYKMLSIIQQDVFVFDDTLENNITLFKQYDDSAIQKAIAGAELYDYVSKNGLDSRCGENGNKLSGGEKQRISIGRALIKNTPILILDEATSSLDNATAFSVEQTILNLKDITCVVVTHKLNKEILKQYDKILVLNNGKIVEDGTFDELIQRKSDFSLIYNVSGSNDLQ